MFGPIFALSYNCIPGAAGSGAGVIKVCAVLGVSILDVSILDVSILDDSTLCKFVFVISHVIYCGDVILAISFFAMMLASSLLVACCHKRYASS